MAEDGLRIVGQFPLLPRPLLLIPLGPFLSGRHDGPFVEGVAVDEDVGVLVLAPDIRLTASHPPSAVWIAFGMWIGLGPFYSLVIGLLHEETAIFRHLLANLQLPAVEIRAVLGDVRGTPCIEYA